MENFTTEYPYLTWHLIFVLLPSIYLWIKHWRYYIKFSKTFIYITILSVIWGALFDTVALRDDMWFFNQEKSLGILFWDIPLEEWFFFFFVPQFIIAFVLLYKKKRDNESF